MGRKLSRGIGLMVAGLMISGCFTPMRGVKLYHPDGRVETCGGNAWAAAAGPLGAWIGHEAQKQCVSDLQAKGFGGKPMTIDDYLKARLQK